MNQPLDMRQSTSDGYVSLSERIAADQTDLRLCVRAIASRRTLSLAQIAEACHDAIEEIKLAGEWPDPADLAGLNPKEDTAA